MRKIIAEAIKREKNSVSLTLFLDGVEEAGMAAAAAPPLAEGSTLACGRSDAAAAAPSAETKGEAERGTTS